MRYLFFDAAVSVAILCIAGVYATLDKEPISLLIGKAVSTVLIVFLSVSTVYLSCMVMLFASASFESKMATVFGTVIVIFTSAYFLKAIWTDDASVMRKLA